MKWLAIQLILLIWARHSLACLAGSVGITRRAANTQSTLITNMFNGGVMKSDQTDRPMSSLVLDSIRPDSPRHGFSPCRHG